MCQLELYKTCFYSRGKRCKYKIFKTQNPNLFLIHPSSNIEPLYPPNTLYLCHSFTKLSNVCGVGSNMWNEGHKCSFSFTSRGTMCEDSTSFDFLSVHSPAYLPYYIPIIVFHEFLYLNRWKHVCFHPCRMDSAHEGLFHLRTPWKARHYCILKQRSFIFSRVELWLWKCQLLGWCKTCVYQHWVSVLLLTYEDSRGKVWNTIELSIK